MTVTIEVPNNYGYVVLSCLVGSFVTNMYMSSNVMKARKQYNIEYPNLYAVPSVHKDADLFNRVQRGHQSFFETLTIFSTMTLINGFVYPITSCILAGCFNIGNILYQLGYSDPKLDVQTARHMKGGVIRLVGIMGAAITSIKVAGKWNGWW